MNEFVATVIGEVNAALKKKGWKKRGRAPSIEAIVEKTTELLRVATDKELAAAYGDDGKKYTTASVGRATWWSSVYRLRRIGCPLSPLQKVQEGGGGAGPHWRFFAY